MSENRHYVEDAAAYVLGALEPEEADALERHIATCSECAGEVETLRGTLDAFAASAPALTPPRRLRGRVLRAVRREAGTTHGRRLGWTPRLALAGAAAAIALAAVIVASSGNGSRLVRASIGAASVRISGQRAELIVAHLPRASAGRTYEIWLQRGSAAPERSTLFNVDSRGGSEVAVAGSVHGVRRLLVTEEPAGGTSAPTVSPVIVASIS